MSLFDPKTHDRPIEYTSDAHQSNVTTELEEQLTHIFGRCNLEPHPCWYTDNVSGKSLKDWQVFEMRVLAIQAIIDTKVREAEQKLLDWLEIDIYDETPDDVTNHELGEWIESRRKLLSTEEEGTK